MKDYEIPTIELSEAATETLGKYGRMREQYLQAHKPELYNSLLLSGTLHAHLLEAAEATKELKARDLMRWVGLMNCCKAQVEEIIFNDLIYN